MGFFLRLHRPLEIHPLQERTIRGPREKMDLFFPAKSRHALQIKIT